MPYAQTADKYTVYVPQGSKRTTFSHFNASGIDLFSSPGSQNENGFLQLENVLPSTSGGFQRRWGVTNYENSPMTSVYRMFPYQVSAQGAVSGVYYSGFANYYSFLTTDNLEIRAVYNEGTNDGQAMSGFSGSGEVYATTSRDFLYGFDGVYIPQKKHFAKGDNQTTMGFPFTLGAGVLGTIGNGKGYNPGTTTVTMVDTSGSGSGASLTPTFNSDGSIVFVDVVAAGTAYNYPTTTVSVVDTSGAGSGALFSYAGSSTGAVLAVYGAGPISLVQGREYALAFINSKTGHTSDVEYASQNGRTASPRAIYVDENGVTQEQVSGETQIEVLISFDTTTIGYFIDSQVDTVLLMATSDGGDLNHLYEVTQIPLSSFTGTGTLTYTYYDTLPDTYTDGFSSGDTLLEENLWADVDAFGNTIGIINNTPPLTTFNKPVLNQGRMFTTDGKSVFFSKSLSEVTTSTGLITSKWEEAWPANNRLDIGFNNEIITGLLSDTTFLYIGTTQNIYRLSGTDINSFDLQCIFRNVGLLSQDAWSVVYKEQLPAGYLWVTPDNKVILSDFNNYEDVGTQIYPDLLGDTILSLQSWVHGPYPMAFLRTANNQFWVLNLSSNSWYNWTPNTGAATAATGAALTYTKSNGSANLWFIVPNTSPITLAYFDPTKTTDDYPTSGSHIGWTIQTGWQDMGDTTNMKVINEVEAWSDEAAISVGVTSKSGNTSSAVSNSVAAKLGPIASLQDCYKAYFAAYPTGGKFFSFTFTGTTLNNSSNILDQFVVEHFPFGRF